ncbi:NAD-dependent epimerase/dehydratase family protein [Adhaeretor mobilis]|uniref:GDP-6-deoxy-D-mannose reductase n=1 Tax=Adhaeretor mobilis TaxID=1930276 RepID=A0A517MR54_9BACT|nr:NAD-dependent epimerase/dehydratase family protein [Adhaeretor mobilis]QDS97358.1 GDP-6-deoxy-D-mannose reductase [Adhaeretor mobilis]
MPRCLITGATGFVGSNLAKHVGQLGWDMRCLVRPSSDTSRLDNKAVTLVTASLETGEGLQAAVENVDYVFHVAGRTTALQPAEFDATNVAGAKHLAEACAQQTSPPTLVMVSSLAAGGPGTFEQPRREGDLDQPVSDYGRSKLSGEKAASKFAEDVPLSIIRPPIIFGPGDHAGLSLYKTISTMRIHLRPGFRKFPVSLVHVNDLCQAMTTIAQRGERVQASDNSGRAAGTYYVAAERALPYAELGRVAGAAAGWATLALPFPPAGFWIAGAIGELFGHARRRACLLNFDKIREALSVGWVCSDEKIRQQLGYQPAATLEERFSETVAWYRQQGWL